MVEPADCPPIRAISRYGFYVTCPGEVVFERLGSFQSERIIGEDFSAFGLSKISGGKWPETDSDFIASWIAGSEYVKIHTGIEILFPSTTLLYQGPIPNDMLLPAPVPGVMAGLEFFRQSRSLEVNGELLGIAELNIIVKLPRAGERTQISRGDLLAWIFPLGKNVDLASFTPS